MICFGKSDPASTIVRLPTIQDIRTPYQPIKQPLVPKSHHSHFHSQSFFHSNHLPIQPNCSQKRAYVLHTSIHIPPSVLRTIHKNSPLFLNHVSWTSHSINYPHNIPKNPDSEVPTHFSALPLLPNQLSLSPSPARCNNPCPYVHKSPQNISALMHICKY